jgi:hypothetical protein
MLYAGRQEGGKKDVKKPQLEIVIKSKNAEIFNQKKQAAIQYGSTIKTSRIDYAKGKLNLLKN